MSPDLLNYLRGLGLTDAQIQSLLTSASGADGPLNESDIAHAAARYAAALAAGTLETGTPAPAPGPPPGTPGATPGVTPGATPAPTFAPAPEWGLPPITGDAASGDAYNAALATGLLGGTISSPGAWAAASRGQDPANRAGGLDAGPEANLPSMPYAGKVLGSVLTPEQAGSIRYNTPEFKAFLDQQAAQRPENIGNTANNLANAYRFNAYAGNSADLNAAINTAYRADYDTLIGRMGLTPEMAAQRGYTYDWFIKDQGSLKGNLQGNMPQTGVAGQAQSLAPMQTTGPIYGGGPITANQPGAMGYFPPAGTPIGTAPSPGGGYPGGQTPGPPPETQMPRPAENPNVGYAANILGVAPGQRTAAQNASLTASSAKVDPTTLKNLQYEANILAVPEPQRTAAQRQSLAAAQAKLGRPLTVTV